MKLIDALLSGDIIRARELMEERIEELFVTKLESFKRDILEDYFEDDEESLDEGNIQVFGRTKLIRLRVRAGKVQRRRKFSTVKGYTIRGGRMVRMTPQERRHRKMGARKAKIKRRGKISQILRKRRISLRKRRAMGVR